MKKFIALIAALVLCFALCISASAYTASDILNTNKAPTGTAEVTYNGRTVTAEVYPASTSFVANKDVPGKYFSEFQLMGPDGKAMGYYVSGMGFALPDDGQVYCLSVFDGNSFTSEDVYVTTGTAEPEAPAQPAEQKVTVNGETYNTFLKALMAQTEDAPVTLKLETDIQMVASQLVIGSSDYNGLFGGMVITVIPHDVTIDLNGHTINGEKDCVLFEVQEGYSLTIIDSSEEKTGKLVSQTDEIVILADGSDFMPFTDLTEGETFYEDIKWVYAQGLMNGMSSTTFDRKANISRQQVWMVMARASGAAPKDMYEAKAWAIENGIADGTLPGQKATREEVVTMMWLTFGKPAAAKDDLLAEFSDADKVSADCKAAMEWAVENDIIRGDNGSLLPSDLITRGAFAAVLHRYLGK